MNKINALKNAKLELNDIYERLEDGDLFYPQDAYREIEQICMDYEDNANDSSLYDYLQEQYIIDDEGVTLELERLQNDLTRIRYFIGNTYDADIYRIDGYGNLANVDTNYMKDLCEEMIDEVDRQIEDEKVM